MNVCLKHKIEMLNDEWGIIYTTKGAQWLTLKHQSQIDFGQIMQQHKVTVSQFITHN